jgi:UDP-N-acetylmuramoyl-tripeptide--D-alanyl-D-alanine ligase
MATPIPSNRVSFACEQLAEISGGKLSGPRLDRILGVVTDSRAVTPGSLFVALVGERFDAHAFVEQAASSGASAVMVRRGSQVPESVTAIHVDDTLVALGQLARAHRRAWGGQLIGITGSAGKTGTKELTAAGLQAAGRRVLKTLGNLNNRIGVPHTLFQLDASVDTAVVEMGTSEPGEIAALAEMASPDIGVVTRVGLAHVEKLGSLEAVADEKTALLRALDAHGVAVAYGDDPLLRARASVIRAKRRLFFGTEASSDVRLLESSVGPEGTRARLLVEGRPVEIGLRLFGEGAVMNAAASLAVSAAMGLSLEATAQGMAQVAASPGRLQPRSAERGILIIDDSYNANPLSAELALRTAERVARHRGAPLLVALGDMKELGLGAAEAHRQLGERVADVAPQLFVGVGEHMRDAVAVAQRRGIETLWYEDSAAAGAEALRERLPDGAVLLVKGSRSVQMERMLEPLLEEPAR